MFIILWTIVDMTKIINSIKYLNTLRLYMSYWNLDGDFVPSHAGPIYIRTEFASSVHDESIHHSIYINALCAEGKLETQQFRWDVYRLPSYILNLAPSEFHLFSHIKQYLGGKLVKNEDDLNKEIESQLSSMAVGWMKLGWKKTVPIIPKVNWKSWELFRKINIIHLLYY